MMQAKHINLRLIILGLFLLFSIQHLGQSWYIFTGTVSDIENGNPVPQYPVVISAVDSGMVVLTHTDDEGIYFDSLFVNLSQGNLVVVEVYDCEGTLQSKTFENLDDLNVADFSMCVSNTECTAYFEFDLLEQTEVHFFNLSEGYFSTWQWDFGDGTVSAEIDPAHFYNAPGEYLVSLTIQDTLTNCLDTYSQWIAVGDTIGCIADFTFILDTLNNQKNTYLFEDVSTGNPQLWFWDFGDGNYSEEKSPVHTYETAGSYTVCLTISSSNGGLECEDKKCKTITTIEYFNFGGHAFLGEYPLNLDDTDSSNVAVAHLYRQHENQWKKMDSREFWKYGYYWFADKPVGKYLVWVELLPLSVDFGDYAPSYYGNTVGWANARAYNLGREEVFDVNIHLQPMSVSSGGIGSINGTIQAGADCGDDVLTEESIVYLFNSDEKLISFTYVTSSGTFYFDGLAIGTYSVKLEMTGKFGEKVGVNLSDQDYSISNLVLHYNCNAFVGVHEFSDLQQPYISSIYPQPATNYFGIDIYMAQGSQVSLQLIDINGLTVFSEENWLTEGLQKIRIDRLNVKSGLYVLRIEVVEMNRAIHKKILFYH